MVDDDTPYPDKDFTERERWAESEAAQFIKNAQALDNCIDGWINGKQSKHPDNYKMAMECAYKAQGWRAAADSLRRSRIARLEYNPDRGY